MFNSEAQSKYYELLKEKQGAGEIQANEEALRLGEARLGLQVMVYLARHYKKKRTYRR
nr:hypothetical protein [Bacillus wiedmannii]